jgi:hypothetical protein
MAPECHFSLLQVVSPRPGVWPALAGIVRLVEPAGPSHLLVVLHVMRRP